jgi:hypothetical protein
MNCLDIRLDMDDTALAPFRAAWERAAEREGSEPAGALARRALAHHAELAGPVPPYLRAHIDLIPEIAELLGDDDWQLADDARRGLAGALAYFTDPCDLIPDDRPEFGLLDDAIVIELALSENRHEWLAWQEFAAMRRGFPAIGTMNRQRWAQLRRELTRLASDGRNGSYVESRFAPQDRRSRYRKLGDLPRIDMH